MELLASTLAIIGLGLLIFVFIDWRKRKAEGTKVSKATLKKLVIGSVLLVAGSVMMPTEDTEVSTKVVDDSEGIESKEEEKDDTEQNKDVPGYPVVEHEVLPNGFHNYWIIPNDIFSIDEEGMQLISEKLVNEGSKNKTFIFFIDDERQYDAGGYSMGRTVYEDGKFEYDYGAAGTSQVAMNKDTYPTEEQFEMFFYWWELAYHEDYDDLDDDERTELVAEKFNVSFEVAKEAFETGQNRTKEWLTKEDLPS
ncbi:hypothetical protein [Jeotgalibacillus marinus]|uniref:Uncharacterized protein n=1 Tax=Jeotgalibacillus marinus TaxID=86667 RepID=A0ABV3Q507_9BACL